MSDSTQLVSIGHEFAMTAIASNNSNVSKQELVNSYIAPHFEALSLPATSDFRLRRDEAADKVSADITVIANTIIDETKASGKDAKNTAIRDFKTRMNRALVKLGQDAKLGLAPTIGLKTTNNSVQVAWDTTELFYSRDEEGNEDREKPMTKAAHTKKYGSKEEKLDAGVPLAKGEHEGVRYIANTQGIADLVATLCELHNVEALDVCELVMAKAKPKHTLNAKHFTIKAQELAEQHTSIDWALMYSDKGSKLGLQDVQHIVEAANG